MKKHVVTPAPALFVSFDAQMEPFVMPYGSGERQRALITDDEYSQEASRRFAKRMRCIRLAACHEGEKPADGRVPARKKRTPTLKPAFQGK